MFGLQKDWQFAAFLFGLIFHALQENCLHLKELRYIDMEESPSEAVPGLLTSLCKLSREHSRGSVVWKSCFSPQYWLSLSFTISDF